MIKSGLLQRVPKFIKKEFPGSTCVLITDHTVKKLYGNILLKELRKMNIKTFLLSVPPGERSKTQKQKTELEERMLALGADRKTVIIALGGGVVGDLAGFIAATFMRGIPYVQVPTTLLAMVDSSIGGKTGINTEGGKNTIGAFWNPVAVFADVDTLKTLPVSHIAHGLAEAIKMFTTSNEKSFVFVQKNIKKALDKDKSVLKNIITQAIQIKRGIVTKDMHETGERMILNFGHTIAHALEKESGYTMPHGHAVALGMLVESELSGMQTEHLHRLLTVGLGFKQSEFRSFNVKRLVRATKGDKKSAHGKVRYVLLEKIGKVRKNGKNFVHEINDQKVEQTIRKLMK